MVKIRLTRLGRHFNPSYRIVVADSHYGRIIEQVGFYDPIRNSIQLDEEKILSWLHKGAQPSDTVRSILSKNGIIKKFVADKK